MISRRAWIGASAALAAGCARKPPLPPPRVSIVRVPAYDQSVYDTVARLFREHKVDVRGKRVVLKPNLVEFDSGTVINTNPLIVHAVWEAVRAGGAASIRIAEGPGHRRITYDMAEAAGYFSLIPQFEDHFTDLNTDEVSPVRLASAHSTLGQMYLPHTVLGADLIVSIPKMKTHHWMGATLSMKNFFGVVPGSIYGWPKNVLHWAGIAQSIADLHSTFGPKSFALVDGIDAMEGNGPVQGTRKHTGVLVAGWNLPAVDATCCRIMSIDPSQIEYLQLVADPADLALDHVRQIGEPIESVRTRFEMAPNFRHIRTSHLV